MVRPCKGCDKDKQRKECSGCDDWREWFPQAYDMAAERIREVTGYYERHDAERQDSQVHA